MDAQVEVSQWLGQLANVLPFGYAFGAGMVSAVNPCGFAMLPVYLTLYLGAENSTFQEQPRAIRILKAAWVTLIVTAGFALLFGLVGILVSMGGSFLMDIAPWFAVVVGGALVLLGMWMLLGRSLSLHFIGNWAARIGNPQEISNFGFFLFGLAFGATSLSCTFPIFLMIVGSSLTAGDFSTGLLHFISYIMGMGSVMFVLTLGIAVVKEGVVVGAVRKALPYVQKVSSLLLIVAGGYIIYYWYSSGLLAG